MANHEAKTKEKQHRSKTRKGPEPNKTPTQKPPDLPLTQGEVPPSSKTCTLKLYCFVSGPANGVKSTATADQEWQIIILYCFPANK